MIKIGASLGTKQGNRFLAALSKSSAIFSASPISESFALLVCLDNATSKE